MEKGKAVKESLLTPHICLQSAMNVRSTGCLMSESELLMDDSSCVYLMK